MSIIRYIFYIGLHNPALVFMGFWFTICNKNVLAYKLYEAHSEAEKSNPAHANNTGNHIMQIDFCTEIRVIHFISVTLWQNGTLLLEHDFAVCVARLFLMTTFMGTQLSKIYLL